MWLHYLEEGTVAGVEAGHGEGEVQTDQAECLGLRDAGQEPVELLLAEVGPVQHQARGLLLHRGGQRMRRDPLPGQVDHRPERRVQTHLVPRLTNPAMIMIQLWMMPISESDLAALASSEVVRSLNTGSITSNSSNRLTGTEDFFRLA